MTALLVQQRKTTASFLLWCPQQGWGLNSPSALGGARWVGPQRVGRASGSPAEMDGPDAGRRQPHCSTWRSTRAGPPPTLHSALPEDPTLPEHSMSSCWGPYSCHTLSLPCCPKHHLPSRPSSVSPRKGALGSSSGASLRVAFQVLRIWLWVWAPWAAWGGQCSSWPAGLHSPPRPGRARCPLQTPFRGVRGHLASGPTRPAAVASTGRTKALDVANVPSQGQKQGPVAAWAAQPSQVGCIVVAARSAIRRPRLDPGCLLAR